MQKTIIAKNTCPGDEYYLGIIVNYDENTVPDPIEAMRMAAAEHIVNARLDFDDPFNWGDLVNEVPAATMKKYGVTIMDTFISDMVVEHDESLKPEL